MNIEIKTRPYEDKDQASVIDLILTIQQKEFNVPIDLERQPDLLIIPAYYQVKKGNFWVATANDKVIGSIALIDCGEGVGCIRKMFVNKDFRGKEHNIAQNLLNLLLKTAKDNDFTALYLGTIARLEAAIRFYERNGWTLIPKADLPASFPIMPVDTHFFQFEIKH
jgi:N-acetylglutamate synthase-like GNAT family acetyltransferase